MVYLSLVVERHQRHLTVGDGPDAPKGVVVAADGRKHQQLLQFRMAGHYGLHRFQVDDVDAFVEGHPKPMETVLGNASARLAVQTEPWLHDTIAVVTHQATAVGGNPKEPVGIHEDIADMVMGETVAQVEGCQVVTVCEQVASVNYRGVWSVECGVRNDFEEREEGSEE